MRLGYFVNKEDFVGLDSLYFTIDDDNPDEHIKILLTIALATRISMLKMYLLSQHDV